MTEVYERMPEKCDRMAWIGNPARPLSSRSKAAFVASVTSLVFFLLNISPYLLPGDSGELISASYTLGIAHPPGYPLYTLLGNLFSRVFAVSSVAFRYNLMSALIASAMAAVMVTILIEVGISPWLSVLITLLFSTSKATWFEATAAEVYAASSLLLALMLSSFLKARKGLQSHWLLLGYIGGLSVSHHTTLVFPLVICVVAVAVNRTRRIGILQLMAFMIFFLIAVSVWLYIPIRASCAPTLTWGETDTFNGFLSHITAKGYQWRLRPLTPARFLDFVSFFPLLLKRFGIAGCILSSIGSLFGLINYRRIRSEIIVTIAMVIFFGIHSSLYNIPDIASHIFPAIVPLCLLGAVGADLLYRLLAPHGTRRLIFAAALVVLVVMNVIKVHPRGDELLATKFAEGIVESAKESCGEDCIILTTGDISSFSVLYFGVVEGKDVRVYDFGVSNPKILGLSRSPRDLEEAIDTGVGLFGIDKVAIAGYIPSRIGKYSTRPCGLVNILREPDGCRSPHEFGIDQIGFEPDDYSSRLLKSNYYIQLARWYEDKREMEYFEKYLDSVTVILRDDASTLVNVAGIFMRAGMMQKAYEIATAAVKADPDFFEAHDLLGNMLMAMGKSDAAIKEYRAALRGNPRPAVVYSNLGNAYMGIRNAEEALSCFDKALGLDSTLVNAWIGRGRALEGLGRVQEALQSYRYAYSIDKSVSAAYHAEFSLLVRIGSYDKAVETVKRGLAANPKDAILLSDLGLWYLRNDMLDSAVVYLSSSLREDPGLLTARGNLALAFERMGKKQDAIEQYRIYIENAPDGELKQKAIKALESLTSRMKP